MWAMVKVVVKVKNHPKLCNGLRSILSKLRKAVVISVRNQVVVSRNGVLESLQRPLLIMEMLWNRVPPPWCQRLVCL